MLAAWGPFLFDIGALDFDKLTRETRGRWHEHPIIGRRPAGQFLGPGKKTVAISGVTFPNDDGVGAQAAIQGLEGAAEAGLVYSLVSGSGSVAGLYRLEIVKAEESFSSRMGEPGRISYHLEFALHDDGAGALFKIWP